MPGLRFEKYNTSRQAISAIQVITDRKKNSYLNLPVQRIRCKNCGAVKQAKLGFAEPRYSYTKAFETYVLDLCRLMTIQDVAEHLEISWDVIKDILKSN